MREVVTKVYQYGELSDKAKGKARDRMRQVEAEDFDPDHVIEDFTTIAGILGIKVSTISRPVNGRAGVERPRIYYNVGGYQGDGACFEGSYHYAKRAHVKIREHAPLDATLHRIADELYMVQRQNGYKLWASIASGRESTSHDTTIDVDKDLSCVFLPDTTQDVVQEALRDLMDWLHKQLQAEYEYRLSDEVLAETIEANEYEFHEDGTRA